MILCLGTTPTLQSVMTFAHVQLDEVNRASRVQQFASGKSINVARVLHTLGREVLATGFLGGDNGKLIREELDRAKIPHDFLEVTTPTRLCISVLDEAGGMATELIEEPAAVEPKAYTKLLREFDANLWRAKAVVLSGQLPPGAPADFYAHCVRKANDQRVPVVLDAVGEPFMAALSHKPFVVKSDRTELSKAVDGAVDTDEQLRASMQRLVELGATWVVLMLGAGAAMVCAGHAFWRVHHPIAKGVSAGGGDSFAAGLAAGIAIGETVPQACALAAACEVANAMTPLAGHLHAEDVRKLLGRVRVEAISSLS